MSLSDKFKKLSQPTFWFQCLYYTLKLNGLVSFNLSIRPSLATASRLWNIYSFIFSIYGSLEFIIVVLYYQDVLYPKDIIPLDSKKTLFVVSFILILLSAQKANILYISQFWYRHQIMRLVNEGFELHNHILTTCKDVAVRLPAKSKAMLRAKVPATYMQLAFLNTTFFSRTTFTFNIVLLVYNQWISILMASTIFCGIFTIWQFYLILNQKLIRCMTEMKVVSSSKPSQMRMQRFCDLSDEIDRLACLYSRCLVFTEQLNKYFSAALFTIIAYASAVILFELFLIYGTLAKLVMGVSPNTNEICVSVSIVLFYAVDIFFIVRVSNELSNAGSQPGMILYTFGNDIDDRLNRSVSH